VAHQINALNFANVFNKPRWAGGGGVHACASIASAHSSAWPIS
jgi:hypothetical protein